jgi:hypothetical protein
MPPEFKYAASKQSVCLKDNCILTTGNKDGRTVLPSIQPSPPRKTLAIRTSSPLVKQTLRVILNLLTQNVASCFRSHTKLKTYFVNI